MGFLPKIFRKAPANELLWTSQYLSKNVREAGTTLLHYSHSQYGVFEIYDDVGSFLLSFPRELKLPASLFDNLDYAKTIAKHELDNMKNKQRR